MSTPTNAPTAPTEFDPVKFAKKALVFVAIIAIAITGLATINESKERRKRNRLVEQAPALAPKDPSTRELKAGQWEKFEISGPFKIDMVSGVPLTCKVNDNPQEFKNGPSGGNLDFAKIAPNTLIWRIWLKADRDITVTIR